MFLEIVFWWSACGVVAYLFIILRKMRRDKCHIKKRDVIRGLLFGPLVWIAFVMAPIIIKSNVHDERRTHKR